MLKEGKLYYSISEVADEMKVAPSVLRFWEKSFSFLKPTTNLKGTRHYTQEDIKKVRLIYFLVRTQGMTIAGAKQYLKKNNGKEITNIDVIDTLLSVHDELAAIQKELKDLVVP